MFFTVNETETSVYRKKLFRLTETKTEKEKF